MKKVANTTTKERSGKAQVKTDISSPDSRTVALQFLDTAWRVALPILVITYIGVKLDRQNDTMPLYSLIGFFLSLIMATILVYQQIKSVYPDFFKDLKNKNKGSNL